MPDDAADPSRSSETGEHVPDAGEVSDPLVTCLECGAEVLPRKSSNGVDEQRRAPRAPNCGASLEPRV